MNLPNVIDLGGEVRIAILYEDRSVLAIDKPAGWMLAPTDWVRTRRNLQAAFEADITARERWARARNLRFVRHVHRLDAETTGVLLLVKSPGALRAYTELFARRAVQKKYLAIVQGDPEGDRWTCQLKLAPDPSAEGRWKPSPRGKPCETRFHVLQRTHSAGLACALVEAVPTTGRTHQIRVHLAASQHPVLGDTLYGAARGMGVLSPREFPLALRATELTYLDPFRRQLVRILAPTKPFLRAFGIA